MKENVIVLENKRSSNLELLRLICMLLIILHHFICYGLKAISVEGGQPTDFGFIFNSFLVIAVNCFILISGYCGIKARWKGFFRLYMVCMFYGLFIGVLYSIRNDNYNFKEILLYFFPFSHSSLWFIPNYLYLFLLSPMLNKVIDHCSKQWYIQMLIIWCIITFYFGFLWRGNINVNGYNFMNFIFLYLIGRFIALYIENTSTTKRRIIYVSIYLFCSAIIAASVVFFFHLGKSWILKVGFAYNNPLVIISSIAFFLFFLTLNFHSKVINWCASSSLAIYVIHENRVIRNFLSSHINTLYQETDNHFLLIIYLFLSALAIIIICILIDKARMLITNPVEKMLNRMDFDKYTDQLINRLTAIIK